MSTKNMWCPSRNLTHSSKPSPFGAWRTNNARRLKKCVHMRVLLPTRSDAAPQELKDLLERLDVDLTYLVEVYPAAPRPAPHPTPCCFVCARAQEYTDEFNTSTRNFSTVLTRVDDTRTAVRSIGEEIIRCKELLQVPLSVAIAVSSSFVANARTRVHAGR